MICDEFISKMDITEERFRTLEDMLMKTYQIEKQREKLMKKNGTEYPGIIRKPNINKQPIIKVEKGLFEPN